MWRRAVVGGRPARYGEGGKGQLVVFLHGWGLGQHSYKRPLKRLVQQGARVIAPALPGFGGSADLAGPLTFPAYARWVDEFLTTIGVAEPVVLVGHSFGGGVATQLAHDYPWWVRSLVLVNSLGGPVHDATGPDPGLVAERPLWNWAWRLPRDLAGRDQMAKALPAVLEDLLPNVLANPFGLWRVANLARSADLTAELDQLRRRRLPIVAVWGDEDRVIPRASFDALCTAIGTQGQVVPGSHSWLLADPDHFGRVMTNVLAIARLADTPVSPWPPADGRTASTHARRPGPRLPRQQAACGRSRPPTVTRFPGGTRTGERHLARRTSPPTPEQHTPGG